MFLLTKCVGYADYPYRIFIGPDAEEKMRQFCQENPNLVYYVTRFTDEGVVAEDRSATPQEEWSA